SVPTPRLLTAARHIKNLRVLLSTGGALEDLSFLYGLDQPIETLTVTQLESDDLGPVKSCAASLNRLNISMTGVARDVEVLCRLPKLTGLRLASSGLADLGFVRDLPPMESIHLTHLEEVADFSSLSTQTSLGSLSLYDCPALTDLDCLPPLNAV